MLSFSIPYRDLIKLVWTPCLMHRCVYLALLVWNWYQTPLGPGMPFLDSDTCAAQRGRVIYFCQGFFPCMMSSMDKWWDEWMDRWMSHMMKKVHKISLVSGYQGGESKSKVTTYCLLLCNFSSLDCSKVLESKTCVDNYMKLSCKPNKKKSPLSECSPIVHCALLRFVFCLDFGPFFFVLSFPLPSAFFFIYLV
jgi:hypothetical protein